MIARICILAGLAALVAGAFIFALPLGLLTLGASLLFVGWASLETPDGPV